MTLSPVLTEDQNTQLILSERYLQKDDNNNIIESPEQMFKRVANTIAEVETTKSAKKIWAKHFYDVMAKNEFLPNSPTLMNAGINGTLSACFVIGIEDTMESILYACHKAGMVMKFGGGVGYYLGKIRSKNTSISTTHGKACGPIAVLEQLNQTSKLITQGGKREGANMAILPINHPNIREFIHCKDANLNAGENNQVIDQFNISVSVPDQFFVALENNLNWDLIDPHTNEVIDTVLANDLWNEIHESAWNTGDPGIFFVDTVNKANTTPNLGQLTATNPCGEVPLYDEEACNLGSLNLSTFVVNGQFDYNKLETTIKTATRFLDNVVTANSFPISEIEEAVNKTRKLGLGVLGWHHALIKLNIAYASDEAVELAKHIMKFIQEVASKYSEDLAEERGSFPAWEGSIYSKPRRNATVTAIAPTGTLARLSRASFGIEPVYAWIMESKILRNHTDKSLIDYDPIIPEYFKTNYNGTHQNRLTEFEQHFLNNNTVQNLTSLTPHEQNLFKTANEIDYIWHLRHQAAFQEHTDLAVSKTINMKNTATLEEVKKAYILAHELNCKGITVYRDGSREFQVLNTSKVEKDLIEIQQEKKEITTQEIEVNSVLTNPIVSTEPHTLGWKAQCTRYKIPTPLGPDCLVFVSKDKDDYAREVVVVIGKGGADIQTDAEAIGRTITLGLKYGVPMESVHSQLMGITSGRVAFFQEKQIKSLSDAVAFALSDYINNPEVAAESLSEEISSNHNYCPECSNQLIFQEACLVCSNPQCSYSKC